MCAYLAYGSFGPEKRRLCDKSSLIAGEPMHVYILAEDIVEHDAILPQACCTGLWESRGLPASLRKKDGRRQIIAGGRWLREDFPVRVSTVSKMSALPNVR